MASIQTAKEKPPWQLLCSQNAFDQQIYKAIA
jgi:hypothetical protein